MSLPEPEELLLDVRKERIRQVVSLRTRSLVVVLDKLEDTFNMAAVLRTCEGLGVQEVHVLENPEVPFAPHPKVTQGCDKWLDIHRHSDAETCLSQLRGRGFQLLASAHAPDAQSLYSLRFDGKVALIFGNERFGVSPDVQAVADGLFWIPMRGFTQSFNISVAVASTLTYALGWRQQHGQAGGDLSQAEAEQLTERFFLLSVKQRKRIYKKRPE